MLQKFFRKKISKLIVVVAVCGLLIFFGSDRFFSPVKSVFLIVAYPFQEVLSGTGRVFSQVGGFFSSISGIKNENEKLILENQKLLAENSQLQDVRSENEVLRKELNIVPRKDFDLAAALVIGEDPDGAGGWIEIDKGEKDGIVKGMPVIISNGILVGKVEQVYAKSSQVFLITNPQSAISGIAGETETKGIIKGEFGLGLIFDMVLQTENIKEGDRIITSGIGGNIPRGLVVGRIQEVRSSSDQLFQQAVITPYAEFSKLRIVFVIKK